MSHIKWDEETIAEHDKLRGTRQKINEPDTPFEHVIKADDHEDEDATTDIPKSHTISPNRANHEVAHNWEALNAKLTYESMQQKEEDKMKCHEVSIGEYTGDDFREDDQDEDSDVAKKRCAPEGVLSEDAKKKSFADKRAAHYNEFLVLKAMKQKEMDEEEDDDDA